MIKKSVVPAYYQVMVDILDKIKNDIYKVDGQLPSDMEFCSIYGVSRITVRRALAELENDGYIKRIQGKGSFVRFKEINQEMTGFYSFTNETIKMGYVPSSIFISLDLIIPNNEVQEKLNLQDNEKVYLLERLRLADDKIVVYDHSYISEKKIPGFKKSMISQGSLYKALEQYYGFVPNNSEETIEAIAIEEQNAIKMRLKPKTPVLLVKRVSYCDDEIIEYNYRLVNSSVYKYKMKLK